jgi:hypothetical protein
MRPWNVFQSTPPAWGATRSQGDRIAKRVVSIHAPRVGGDYSIKIPALRRNNPLSGS